MPHLNESYEAEIARLRGALMNVMMMLNHNRNPIECAEWIGKVLVMNLTDDRDQFFHYKEKKD
jgi:hypothetical protein